MMADVVYHLPIHFRISPRKQGLQVRMAEQSRALRSSWGTIILQRGGKGGRGKRGKKVEKEERKEKNGHLSHL